MNLFIQTTQNPGDVLLNLIIFFAIVGGITYAIVKSRKRSPNQNASSEPPTYQKHGGFRLHLVNPTNGVRKETIPFVWTFIFGGFYFMAHGIWTHVFIWLLAVPTIIGWFVYPFFAKSIVLNHYLNQGWVEESEYKRMIDEGIAPSTWLGARQTKENQSQSAEVVKVRCPKCGSLNDENSSFCSNCGNNLNPKQ